MFIKLTNTNPSMAGKGILIRTDLIETVYEGIAVREDGSVENVTFVYRDKEFGSWEVAESAEYIFNELQRLGTK